MISSAATDVLTGHDVLQELQRILQHGYGTLEVIVTEGYIRTIHRKESRQGTKPGTTGE